MKVFICWSGERSRLVAEALRKWLPNVIQAVEPFMSEYIEKGNSWPENLDLNLKEAEVGLICLTGENLKEPWIHFEAGALYMQLVHERVCPYVLDLPLSDIPWPLARFQATRAVKEDTRKLLNTVNKALDKSALDTERLNQAFEVWWPKLEEDLAEARKLETKPGLEEPKRSTEELLEEILILVRDQSRKVSSSTSDLQGALTAETLKFEALKEVAPAVYKLLSGAARSAQALGSTRPVMPEIVRKAIESQDSHGRKNLRSEGEDPKTE